MADLAGASNVELEIEGMHCDSCVALIQETLAEDPAVREVAVDLEAGRASVVFDPETTSPEGLCATVVGLGYEARPLTAGAPGT
jgi:copper chaperone CopZ